MVKVNPFAKTANAEKVKIKKLGKKDAAREEKRNAPAGRKREMKGKTPMFGKVKAGNAPGVVAGGSGKSMLAKPFAGLGTKKEN